MPAFASDGLITEPFRLPASIMESQCLSGDAGAQSGSSTPKVTSLYRMAWVLTLNRSASLSTS